MLQDWKTAATHREGRRKEFGEDTRHKGMEFSFLSVNL